MGRICCLCWTGWFYTNSFFLFFLNKFMASFVLCHWLTPNAVGVYFHTLLRMILLILPIFSFVRLSRQYWRLLWEFGLLSFLVLNACFLRNLQVLSSIFKSTSISMASLLMSFSQLSDAFLVTSLLITP